MICSHKLMVHYFFLVLFDIRASFRKSVPSRASGSSFLREVEFKEHDLQSNFQLDR